MGRPSLAETRRPELLEAYARSLLKHGSEGATLDRVPPGRGPGAGDLEDSCVTTSGTAWTSTARCSTHPRPLREGLQAIGEGRAPAERSPRGSLEGIFAGSTDESTARLVDTLLGASAEDPSLRERLREMYLELERLLASALAGAYPGSATGRATAGGIRHRLPGRDERVAHRAGDAADRSGAARACAKQLVASLRSD